jgi:hypothetical protein
MILRITDQRATNFHIEIGYEKEGKFHTMFMSSDGVYVMESLFGGLFSSAVINLLPNQKGYVFIEPMIEGIKSLDEMELDPD